MLIWASSLLLSFPPGGPPRISDWPGPRIDQGIQRVKDAAQTCRVQITFVPMDPIEVEEVNRYGFDYYPRYNVAPNTPPNRRECLARRLRSRR